MPDSSGWLDTVLDVLNSISPILMQFWQVATARRFKRVSVVTCRTLRIGGFEYSSIKIRKKS